MEEEKEYDEELYNTLCEVFEAHESMANLLDECLDHPNSKEHRIWRRGLLDMLAVIQEKVADTIAKEVA